MRILLLIPLVYLAAVAETSLADGLRIGAIAPDLLALTAAVWLVAARGPYTFLAAGGIGLVADLLSPGRIGIGAAARLLIGYAMVRPRWRWAFERVLGQVSAVALAVGVWAATVGFARWLVGDAALGLATILARSLATGLYTAAISLPILLAVSWVRDPLAPADELADY
jgi:rod shape-determining protein MreD